jgi:predicted transcriptional regulator
MALVVLLGTSPAVFAQEPPRGDKRHGLFGEVVTVEGNELLVRTKQGDVRLSLTPDTDYRVPGEDGGTPAIVEGDRIAVVVDQEGDVKTARSVMVIPLRGNVVHSTGVVTTTAEGAVFLTTEDGRRTPVAFGLSGNVPRPGTVVTIVGRHDTEAGVLRARSLQRLDETLDRLSSHLDEIEDAVLEGKSQIQHVERVRHLVERLNANQLKLVNNVLQHFPEEARPALDSALRNLEEANQAVARAFDKALAIAGKVEREKGRPERPEPSRLPKEVRPSLDDMAAALNLSADALTERLGQGRALAGIVQELGLSQQEFEEAVLALVHQRLQRLVEEGRLAPEAVELIGDELRDQVGNLIQQAFTHDTDVRPNLPVSVEDLAKILGVEPSELHALLRQGVSVLHIAERRGVSSDQLAEALADLARQRAQALVATGAVTAEDVHRLLEDIQARIKQHVAETAAGRPGSGEKPSTEAARPRPGLTIRAQPAPAAALQGVPFQLQAIARILELTVEDVRARLSDGTTVAELAEKSGVPLHELVDDLMASMKAKLQAMVEAGNMDKDQAAHLLEKTGERLALGLRESRLSSSGGAPPARTAASLSPSHRPYPNIPLTMEDLARVLSVSVAELMKWMEQKEGIQALLQERGMTSEDLAAALLPMVRKRLGEMVAAGKIDKEKAGVLLAELKRRLLAELSGPRSKVLLSATAVRSIAKPVSYVPFDLRRVADILGISVEELRSLLSQGHSAADIATRRTVPLDALVMATLAPVEARVREALKAGTISDEDAKHKLEAARKAILQALYNFRLPGQDALRPAELDTTKPSSVTVRPTLIPGATEQGQLDEGTSDGTNTTVETHEDGAGTAGESPEDGDSSTDETGEKKQLEGDTAPSSPSQ